MLGVYSATGRRVTGFVYNARPMASKASKGAAGAGKIVKQLGIAGIALVCGLGLLPPLIYVAGAAALGAYEGAGIGPLYRSVFKGMADGSLAAWSVVLGPYALFLLFQLLRRWWYAGT
jgi:hypothetical protein